MWTDDDGYVNDTDGNNSGGGARTVANHWDIFAGGRDHLPARSGHCATAAPCGTVLAGGGVIDEGDTCFRGFGDPAWWRTEMEEAGDYEVFIYASAEYSVFDNVEYEVRAAGVDTRLRVDPSGHDGWLSIGTFTFSAGGDQWVALFDDQTSDPGSNQHIVADAVKLDRVGGWCGDTTCEEAERCSCDDCPPTAEVEGNGLDDDCDGSVDEDPAPDSGPDSDDTDDTADTADTAGSGDSDGVAGGPSRVLRGAIGCGCASTHSQTLLWIGALLALGAARTRLGAPSHAMIRTTGQPIGPIC